MYHCNASQGKSNVDLNGWQFVVDMCNHFYKKDPHVTEEIVRAAGCSPCLPAFIGREIYRPNFIGRALALDLALGSLWPDVGTHVPGVANVGPDARPSSVEGLPEFPCGTEALPGEDCPSSCAELKLSPGHTTSAFA